MKRFVAVLLCIIIPFFLVVPVNSCALDIQGTEYPNPSLLPPDIYFSQYDYYFLTVSGTPENPSYLLYLINDNSAEKHNRLYFTVALSPISTRLNTGEFTSFGVTTNYSLVVKSYNKSGGTWGNSTSTSNFNNFVFDTYSEFTSSYRYIIGSNCDVYSYSGSLVRAGDYDNFCSFFRGNLTGSSDKSEKPTEPTTSGESSGGGGIDIDFSFLSDYFNRIFESFDSVIDNFSTLINVIKKLTDVFGSSEDGSIFYYLSVMQNTFVDFFNNANTKLDEIKTEILNFERYFSEFTAVNGEIHNIFSAISGINQNISSLKQSFETKLDDVLSNIISSIDSLSSSVRLSIYSNLLTSTDRIVNSINNLSNDILPTLISIEENVNSIKNNVSTLKDDFNKFHLDSFAYLVELIESIKGHLSAIRTDFHNFYLNFPADFKDTINSIKSNVSSIYVDLHNFCLNFPADFKDTINSIKSNVSSINSNIKTNFDDLISHIQTSFDNLFDNISLKIGNLTDSEIINSIKVVETAVNNLPTDIAEVLKYLFIPHTDRPKELIEIINQHFGFVHQISELADIVFLSENFDVKVPKFVIKFDSDLFGHFEQELIDFLVLDYSWIIWIKRLTAGMVYYLFLQKLRKRLPDVINGGSL